MRTRALALALVALLAGAGCVSTPKDRSLISLRKANLSLAFTDPALETPVPPRVVQQFIPAPAELRAVRPDLPAAVSALPKLEACPQPPAGAAIDEPAHLAVKTPRPGRYLRYNEGTITAMSGTVELTFPYPFITTMDVGEARVVETPTLPGFPPDVWTHFEVTETLLPGFTEKIEYRYNLDAIELVRRESTSDGGTRVFAPYPPVRVLALASPDTQWQSGGIDGEAGRARAVSGTVGHPEKIDLCGSVVEAVPGTLEVRDAQLGDGAALDGTESPLVQHWIPQYGGLIAKQDVRTSELVQTEQGAVRITYDYVSTLMSVEPIG